MKVVDSKPVAVSEAGRLLAERGKEAELEYEQTQASEHSEKFTHHKPEEADKLAKKLVETNGKLDLETAIKLVDISPARSETLKAVLLRKKVDLSEEEADELLKMVKK